MQSVKARRHGVKGAACSRRSSSPTGARSPSGSSGRAASWASPRWPSTPNLDRDALHVRMADEAYALGGRDGRRELPQHRGHPATPSSRAAPTPSTPGTASSPRTPTSPGPSPSAGVTFIGPPPEAIEVMGDKISSRLAAETAGVAGVPGPLRAAHLARRGRRLRRGARLAGRHQGRLRRRRARHEGRRSGPTRRPRRWSRPRARRRPTSAAPRCYVERYLAWPRHVEMQVLGDTHGNTLWLGRARLLGPAAPPEAGRGEPGTGLPRRGPPGHGRGRGQGLRRPAATSTPARSSSSTRTASSTSWR